MGKTDPTNKNPYKQQSVIIVPAGTPGVTVERALSVYGYDGMDKLDLRKEFGRTLTVNRRPPRPLRAHLQELPRPSLKHRPCPRRRVRDYPGEARARADTPLHAVHRSSKSRLSLRCIPVWVHRRTDLRINLTNPTNPQAEKALEYMIARINDPDRSTFGAPLSSHGVILEWVARSRIEIDAARFLVLNAADMIDRFDAKGALKQIAMAKIAVPSMALTVIDRAVQAHGAAGVCQDFPLAKMWAQTRTLRIADGPDEVHLNQLGRRENKRADEM